MGTGFFLQSLEPRCRDPAGFFQLSAQFNILRFEMLTPLLLPIVISVHHCIKGLFGPFEQIITLPERFDTPMMIEEILKDRYFTTDVVVLDGSCLRVAEAPAGKFAAMMFDIHDAGVLFPFIATI